MKVGAITGGIGDCVYAIPIMRKLGITTVYIKEDFYDPGEGSKYTVMKPLLESQGIQCLPTLGGLPIGVFEPSLKFDVNLDEWRIRGGRDRVHIMKNMMLHYRCYGAGWEKPWLFNIEPYKAAPNLIFLTPRWRDNSQVNWVDVLLKYSLNQDNTVFIGHRCDYNYFNDQIRKKGYTPTISYEQCNDIYEMARNIAGSERLFCNQGVALTIAQGLGKDYWLERKPGKTNTLLFTRNEHLL